MGFLSGMRVGGSDAPWDVAWVQNRLDIKSKIAASKNDFDPARPSGKKRTYSSTTGGSTLSYSRYGEEGKGLSDIAQIGYDLKQRSLVTGLERFYADRKAMLNIDPVTGEETYKGLYQISPESTGLLAYTKEGIKNIIGEPSPTIQRSTTPIGSIPIGFGTPSMGGMRKGDWQRPQEPKEVTTGGAQIGTVVAIGGIGYLIWSLLK